MNQPHGFPGTVPAVLWHAPIYHHSQHRSQVTLPARATLTAAVSASIAPVVRDYSSSKPQADTMVPAEAGNVDVAPDQEHLLLGSVNRGLSTHRPGNAQLYGKS